MPGFLDSSCILFTLLGYKVSLLELLGTTSGYLCVWFASKARMISWPLGIANAAFFFILFYQQSLYSDMFLQVYFFATSMYGWWCWKHPRTDLETDGRSELKVSLVPMNVFIGLLVASSAASLIMGFVMSRIHTIFPQVFLKQAAYPYADTFVALFSIAAQILLSLKKREAWILWIGVDVLASIIYFAKGLLLLSIEYVVFGVIALSGLVTWNKILRAYGESETRNTFPEVEG
jgi:nicotinamide mononucleotide transporter